jgi:hypothetical protein
MATYTPPRGAIAGATTITQGTNQLNVEQPCIAWQQMEPRWRLPETLVGGTLAIRATGIEYLPAEEKESADAYQRRLSLSVLPPYYDGMEQRLAGMLVRKEVRLDGTPEVMLEHLYDIDSQGNNLQVFAGQLAVTMLRYGHVGVLVDFPTDEADLATAGGQPRPDGDRRPYWVAYSPRDIIGWRHETIGGTQRLTQLRLFERLTVPYGEFGEEIVDQVRVLDPGRWRVYRKQSSRGTSFDLVAEGTTTLDEIPFAVGYARRTSLYQSQPALEEIAWLNLQAYQRSSDLSNQLHLAAVPRLVGYGVPASVEEIEGGPESATVLPVDARLEYVEPAGNSYQYQFKHLEEIERQINQLGVAAILGQQGFQESGVAKAIDRSQGDAPLMRVAQSLQDLIDNCLRLHGLYLGQDGGSSMVDRDFVSARLQPGEIEALFKLEQAGKITQETLLIQLAAGNVFVDDFDVDAEIEATRQLQGQALVRIAGNLRGPVVDENGSEETEGPGEEDDT